MILKKMDSIRLMMRSCMVAFTPDTGRPSYFKTVLSWVLIRVFTFAVIVVASIGAVEAIIECFRVRCYDRRRKVLSRISEGHGGECKASNPKQSVI